MIRILLGVHLLLALAMVGVILLQRSEGGVLGFGGSSTGFMTSRQAGNLLTRATAFLATVFMLTSLVLAVLGGEALHVPRQSILDQAAAARGDTRAPVPASAPLQNTETVMGRSIPSPIEESPEKDSKNIEKN